jgi:hypothetical protein
MSAESTSSGALLKSSAAGAFDSIASLRGAGFGALHSIDALQQERFRSIPTLPGVYAVVWTHAETPGFLAQSPAGWCKGKDPTLPLSELVSAWVPDSEVLYIGMAGGAGTRATLRSRLSSYLRHGMGRRAAHWGGRAIWQLSDSDALRLAWRPLTQEDPRGVERAALAAFVARHGKRPFANRTG